MSYLTFFSYNILKINSDKTMIIIFWFLSLLFFKPELMSSHSLLHSST